MPSAMHHLDCPHCGLELRYPERYGGRKVRCRNCGCLFRLPRDDDEDHSDVEREGHTSSEPGSSRTATRPNADQDNPDRDDGGFGFCHDPRPGRKDGNTASARDHQHLLCLIGILAIGIASAAASLFLAWMTIGVGGRPTAILLTEGEVIDLSPGDVKLEHSPSRSLTSRSAVQSESGFWYPLLTDEERTGYWLRAAYYLLLGVVGSVVGGARLASHMRKAEPHHSHGPAASSRDRPRATQPPRRP